MKPLHSIVAKHQELLEKFMQEEEITREMELELEKNNEELNIKLKSCAATLQWLRIELGIVEQARKDMQAREKRLSSKIEWLEQYTTQQMRTADIKKILTSVEFPHTFYVRKNQDSLVRQVSIPTPREYALVETIVKCDNTRIKKDLQEGKEIEGFSLTNTYSIIIK